VGIDADGVDRTRLHSSATRDGSFTSHDQTTLGMNARMTWDITPDLTLTSISAFRRQDVKSFFHLDSAELPPIQFQNDGGGDTQK
jgi:hypothetical protein